MASIQYYTQKGVYWWKEKGKAVSDAIAAHVRALEDNNTRMKDYELAAKIYGGAQMFGVSPMAGYYPRPPARRSRINGIRRVVDAQTAYVADEKVRVVVLPDGGDFRLQRSAKNANKYILGILTENSVYDDRVCAYRDSCLFGAGGFKVGIVEDRVCIERLRSCDLLFDEEAARYGFKHIRSLYHVTPMAKDVALAKYGHSASAKTAIQNAKPPDNTYRYRFNLHGSLTDYVGLREAWHLRSNKDANDGRHVICTDAGVLLDEAYEYDYFPVALSYYSDPVSGLMGDGLANMLMPLHVTINKYVNKLHDSIDLLGVPRILVDDSTHVPSDHMNAEVGAFIKASTGATPPTIVPPVVVPPDLWHQIEFLLRQMYEDAGLSELTVASKKPPGINAGVALREFLDNQYQRLSVQRDAYNKMWVRLGMHVLYFSNVLYKQGVKLGTKVRSKGEEASVSFGDLDYDENRFDVSVQVTSMLPKMPFARSQQIKEWQAEGYIDRLEAMRLLDIPDLESKTSLMTASIDDIDATIDRLIYGEPTKEEMKKISHLEGDDLEAAKADLVYEPPDETQDVIGPQSYGQRSVLAAYLKSKHNGTPEPRQELLLRFLADAEELTRQLQPPAPMPGPQMPGGMPGAEMMGPGAGVPMEGEAAPQMQQIV